MSYYELKQPPKREDRLNACIAHGSSVCGMGNKKGKACLMQDGERGFQQGSICLLLPALGMLNSMPGNVVLLHSSLGCSTATHSQNGSVRYGNLARTGKLTDVIWASTALNETDVISGGEEKLTEAIKEIDARYKPYCITVVSACVPGIIGDDIDAVIQNVQPEVDAVLLPVHCEGFRTKIWATAYDAVYHGISRTLFSGKLGDVSKIREDLKLPRLEKTINIMNVSSMGRIDELELERLVKKIGLEANIFPVYAHPQSFVKASQAALSVSTCPTHDDYFLDYLKERFDVPYTLAHMPIGIENTGLWLKDIADRLGLGAEAETVIKEEETALHKALAQFKEYFKGKRVFVSAGEFRALSTSLLLEELGFEVVGIRSFHHDAFADNEYEKLNRSAKSDYVVNIANVQPFEEANLLKKLKPDLFLGHTNGNATAAKLGIPTHPIYYSGIAYIGYAGAYQLAKRLYRLLKNPSFNRNLSKHVTLPYKQEWYSESPFAYIKGGNSDG